MNKKANLLLGLVINMINTDPIYKEKSLEDILMYSNEKVSDITFGLTLEIRSLLENGYTEEEILASIEKLIFNKEDNLTEEEEKFIKKDAVKTLKLINKNKERGYDIYE